MDPTQLMAQALAPEISEDMAANYERNRPYLKFGAGNYNTNLGGKEPEFRSWLQQNKVPFDPKAQVSDYDMRGFWNALQNGDPRALSGVNANDGRMHFSDVWKTPYHSGFSGAGGPYTEGSQWAGPVAPQWNAQDQLISPGGRILRDERAPTADLLRTLMGRR